MMVKYLTSSRLTKLQLRDAAMRRTVLTQCILLLHSVRSKVSLLFCRLSW